MPLQYKINLKNYDSVVNITQRERKREREGRKECCVITYIIIIKAKIIIQNKIQQIPQIH